MHEICPLADLPRGEARRVDMDPPIAVFHTDDGEVFAVDDTCTHQDASLADGWLEGCEIECPLHASTIRSPHRRGRCATGEAAGAHPRGGDRRRDGQRGPQRGGTQPAPRCDHQGRRRGRQVKPHRRHRCLTGRTVRRPGPLRAQGFDGELTVVGGESQTTVRPTSAVEGVLGRGRHRRGPGAGIRHRRPAGTVAPRGARERTRSAPRDPCDSMTGPPWPPTASWWPPGHGHGPGQAPRISPACTCCAPSRTPWRCAPNCSPGARLVVIGAGFIGAEVASTAIKLGLDVTVVEAASTPLAGPLGKRLGAVVARLHAGARRRACCAVSGWPGCRVPTGSPRCNWPMGANSAPTSSWSASARPPTWNGCRTAPCTFLAVWCVTRAAQRRSRTWSRWATARPGMSRRWVGVIASSTGQAHWSARRSRWRHCSPADAATARPPSPVCSGRISTACGFSIAGIAGPDDDITFEEGGPDEGSFLAVYRRGNQPVASVEMRLSGRLTVVTGRSQTGRACWVTSSRPATALAIRRMPKPRRYLPRSWVCSTSSRSSSAPSNRKAVDLCTPMSAATSLTPASPRWARISSTLTARSTDCTPPLSLRLLLMTQLYEPEHLLHIEKRDAHCAVIALTQEDSP